MKIYNALYKKNKDEKYKHTLYFHIHTHVFFKMLYKKSNVTNKTWSLVLYLCLMFLCVSLKKVPGLLLTPDSPQFFETSLLLAL